MVPPDTDDPVGVTERPGPAAEATPGASTGRHRPLQKWNERTWRAVFFAPVGDGQTRRRGSDAFRLGLAALTVVVCWLSTRANSKAEHAVATTLAAAPNGVQWLTSAIWWTASFGLVAVIAVLAVGARRWSTVRDIALSGLGAWLLSVILGLLLGSAGG